MGWGVIDEVGRRHVWWVIDRGQERHVEAGNSEVGGKRETGEEGNFGE